jgi:hypothetical protein
MSLFWCIVVFLHLRQFNLSITPSVFLDKRIRAESFGFRRGHNSSISHSIASTIAVKNTTTYRTDNSGMGIVRNGFIVIASSVLSSGIETIAAKSQVGEWQWLCQWPIECKAGQAEPFAVSRTQFSVTDLRTYQKVCFNQHD